MAKCLVPFASNVIYAATEGLCLLRHKVVRHPGEVLLETGVQDCLIADGDFKIVLEGVGGFCVVGGNGGSEFAGAAGHVD